MSKENIRPITMEHIRRCGDIYAKAFSVEPWNDPWKTEDAVIHVRELLESKQAYGLEYSNKTLRRKCGFLQQDTKRHHGIFL